MSRFYQPRTMEELAECHWKLAACADYLIVAGGTDVMVKKRETHHEPDTILSLAKLTELREINCDGASLFIGSMATHADIASNIYVKRYFSALGEACSQVGSAQIRNRGTIGGNIVTASPAGDTIPCLYLYDAQVLVMRASGNGEAVPISEFMLGRGKVQMYHGDIVLGVILPVDPDISSRYIKLARREAVSIAEISMAVKWETTENGLIHMPKSYLGSIDTTPLELKAFADVMEGALGRELQDEHTVSEYVKRIAAEAEAMIRKVREARSRAPRLRLTEAEQLYKERAVAGVIWDAVVAMK